MQPSNKTKALNLLMKNSSYNFSCSFYSGEKSALVRKIVNELFETNKEIESTLLALSLVPVLKWMLDAKDINKMTASLIERGGTKEISKILNCETILSQLAGTQQTLLLESRCTYFERVEELLAVMEDALESIEYYPQHGIVYAQIIKGYFFCKLDGNPLSGYKINQLLSDAILTFASICNDKVSKIMDKITESRENICPEEFQYVYHNIPLLLKEYSKIVWYAKTSNDKAVRLLGCSTDEEMVAITESDSKYNQAFLIAQYIKLIFSSIEMLKAFPQMEVQKTTTCDVYKTMDAYMRTQRVRKTTDKDMAESLNMSIATYKKNLNIGTAALAAILFGSDCNVFIDMLTGVSIKNELGYN